jgi:hypothetical protein
MKLNTATSFLKGYLFSVLSFSGQDRDGHSALESTISEAIGAKGVARLSCDMQGTTNPSERSLNRNREKGLGLLTRKIDPLAITALPLSPSRKEQAYGIMLLVVMCLPPLPLCSSHWRFSLGRDSRWRSVRNKRLVLNIGRMYVLGG